MRRLSYQVNLSVGHKGINECIPWVHGYILASVKGRSWHAGWKETEPPAKSPSRSIDGCQGCGEYHGTLPMRTANIIWDLQRIGWGTRRMLYVFLTLAHSVCFYAAQTITLGSVSTVEIMNLIQEPLHEILQPVLCLRSNYNNYGLKITSL